MDLSISIRNYPNKTLDWDKVTYKRQHLTIDEMGDLIKQGFCFCHCFKTKKEVFGTTEKTYKNFEKADLVFVDVDDCCTEMNQFVSMLSKKPTIYYTTPNNMTEKSHFLYRFRHVYQFEESITNVGEYKSLYNAIMRSVYEDIPTFKCEDNCGVRANQQFGGNGTENCEMTITHNVFSFSDFPFEDDNVSSSFSSSSISFLNGKSRRRTPHAVPSEKIADTAFLSDFNDLQPLCFLNKYGNVYHFFESTTLTYDDGYTVIPDDYIEICRKKRMETVVKKDGTSVRFPKIEKLRDGQHRRKKLYIGALIRKQIQPTISLELLLYNLVYERETLYDNSDNVITNKVLMEIATEVINTPIEEITINSKPRRKKRFVVDKEYCRNNYISPNAYKNVVKKKLKDKEIGDVYDCSKSVAENLEMLRAMGIKVGKSKLYQWCKENGIPTNPNKPKVNKT